MHRIGFWVFVLSIAVGAGWGCDPAVQPVQTTPLSTPGDPLPEPGGEPVGEPTPEDPADMQDAEDMPPDIEDASDDPSPSTDLPEPEDAPEPEPTHGTEDITERENDPDLDVDYTCLDPEWMAGMCGPGEEIVRDTSERAQHIPPPERILYTDQPPSHGSHRPQWAKWGRYEFLPPQRWLHNLEHGGVALLYHPCAPRELIDDLLAFARAVPEEEDGGPFRWILTPAPDLPTAIAAVTWGRVYQAACFDESELQTFLEAGYRQAPEDVARDGNYDDLWLGR